MKRTVLGVMALAALLALPVSGLAKDWPAKPIQVIIPWPPGNDPSTAVMNVMAPLLKKELGQPVKVVNKPGGGGVLGAKDLADARPDGYTFGVMAVGPMMSQVVMGKTPYKADDFMALGMAWSSPFTLAVKGDAPYKNLKELAEYAKANPGKLRLGHWGVGAVPTAIAMNIARQAGFTWQDTPYQDVTPLLLTQGTADAVTISSLPIMDYVANGEVRPLAVLLPVRLPSLPDVPTVAEQGFGKAYSIWFGLFAPAKTDRETALKFRNAFFKVMEMPEVQEAIAKIGVVPHPTSPEAATAQIASEMAEFDVIMKDLGWKK